ncbi:hypothetical protein [Kocuria sp. LHG3120]|uniref:hypothetical protein n=1 Tax=Kocuria sp. LHG3120 TaxID=2804590 RepID=UPI003CF69445
MKTPIKLATVTAALVLALAGCSGDAPEGARETFSASPTASARATPAPTKAAPPRPSASATEARAPEVTEEPAHDVAAPLVVDDGLTISLAEFLNSGGVCNSDYFPAGPPTEAAIAEIQTHCANVFPTDENGYKRPEADAHGYVGPSEEYGSYDGFVEPGFEYQVGSECFEPALGRCKSSGEIQSEWMEPQTPIDDYAEQGFGCHKDSNGNDYCIDPAPPMP